MKLLKEVLTSVVGENSVGQIFRYIDTINSPDDIREYLYGLLDPDDETHRNAINEAVEYVNDRRFALKSENKSNGNATSNNISLNSSNNHDNSVQQHKATAAQAFVLNSKQDTTKGNDNSGVTSSRRGGKGKKGKFVPLFAPNVSGKAGDLVPQIPGRVQCTCQATRHKLVNNCLGCGRIVCEQEGSGPCFTCSELVASKEELEILSKGGKQAELLRVQLMVSLKDSDSSSNNSAGQSLFDGCDHLKSDDATFRMQTAIEHKNRLLEYDRSSARRTKVIDDEMDYFAPDTNTWLSAAERERVSKKEAELHELRHISKLKAPAAQLNLDFAGRRVDLGFDTQNASRLKACAELYEMQDDGETAEGSDFRGDGMTTRGQALSCVADVNDAIKQIIANSRQQFSQKLSVSKKLNQDVVDANINLGMVRTRLRNQDSALLELRDDGMCLSMHQPWASLLVRGIKKDEGRSWYSTHRGRLWIASSIKPPSIDDIRALEQHYNLSRSGDKADVTSMLADYPVGCLLGCVNVIDCLGHEDYLQAYPDGESAEDFVFVCRDHCELALKFPIKGEHKVYKLDSHVHESVRKQMFGTV